jgi:integral membrane sensor domain MASE1
MVACGLVLLTDWFPAMIVALMFARFSFILWPWFIVGRLITAARNRSNPCGVF